ncbi:transposable element Tc3 transposase [Trichonephila clavipes]|uniref:Transposable element Tc3 transposase n=1 Tax=Trichonephila clavipes TaxID=2585209 RepID=A0A8X6VYT4_TRICX|nr:transposable element Tc3 transposase [Trichonephila clavipes]
MMDGCTGLHFLDTASVTAQRYIDEVLEPYFRLFRKDVGPDFIFMDDNAPCHRAVLIDDFLETENIQRMSKPAKSPDLNAIDHSLVYADKPETLEHLEDNIRRAIADIRPQMLEKVIENWTFRLDYIRASRGSHMPEIIFKI